MTRDGKPVADLEAASLTVIAAKTGSHRQLAETLHDLVKTHASLAAETWCRMRAYVNAGGEVVVFFQRSANSRFATPPLVSER